MVTSHSCQIQLPWLGFVEFRTATMTRHRAYNSNISNNLSCHQKHPSVPVGSDGSDGTSYTVTEKYMLSVAQVTGRVPYLPPLLCAWIHTITMTSVLHSSQGLQLCCSRVYNTWWSLCLFPAECHISPLHYCYILDAALSPYMFSFQMLSLITIQSSHWIHCFLLHLLRHYRILHIWNILSNFHTI